MADGSVHRTVTVERISPGAFTVTNARGGQIRFGSGSGADFTPTELLLAAIGGCTAIDVDILTSRRAEPDSLQLRVDADKVRGADGNRLTDIQVTFQIAFPAGGDGDHARAILPDAVKSRMTGCARSPGPWRSRHPLPPRSPDGTAHAADATEPGRRRRRARPAGAVPCSATDPGRERRCRRR
jgi:putative redox protein